MFLIKYFLKDNFDAIDAQLYKGSQLFIVGGVEETKDGAEEAECMVMIDEESDELLDWTVKIPLKLIERREWKLVSVSTLDAPDINKLSNE